MECHVLAINMATFLADTRTPSLAPQIRNPIISTALAASLPLSTSVDIMLAVLCIAVVSSGREKV